MGTNYYIRYNICDCCDRYDELHIGKSSVGWQFSFHAINNVDILMSCFDPKYMLLDDKNTFLEISSFQEWKHFIEEYVVRHKTAKLYNEYDEEQEAGELFDLIETKRSEKNHQANHMKENNYYSTAENDYSDDEGYSFSGGDFS